MTDERVQLCSRSCHCAEPYAELASIETEGQKRKKTQKDSVVFSVSEPREPEAGLREEQELQEPPGRTRLHARDPVQIHHGTETTLFT